MVGERLESLAVVPPSSLDDCKLWRVVVLVRCFATCAGSYQRAAKGCRQGRQAPVERISTARHQCQVGNRPYAERPEVVFFR